MYLPPKLYKYESFSLHSLRNLKRQAVYFSSPKDFNDPYDCAITASIQDLNIDQISIIKKYYLSRSEIPNAIKDEIASIDSFILRDRMRRMVHEVIEAQRQLFVSKRGVTCFSAINDDLLMWSHYGGKYKGFCLEFDTKQEPFSGARQVVYTEIMPQIDPLPVIINTDPNQFLDMLCLKSKSWSYEKEWRILHLEAGTLFTYPSKALTGIYFGPDIAREDLEIIALILAGQNPNVALYRGRRSENAFRVEFESINYIPFIQVK